MSLDRAQGCLMGQLAGDSLGSLTELKHPNAIQEAYPEGVRLLADGGTWNLLAGQPTDDSEMALMLARSLIEKGTYDPDDVRRAYLFWFNSRPFDCGRTIAKGLRGEPDSRSQANGALMRISPLGIFGAGKPLPQTAAWARFDASITHPHPCCQDVNSLFVMALVKAVEEGPEPAELYGYILAQAEEPEILPDVVKAVREASQEPPPDLTKKQGWVLLAFQNALWQLRRGADPETALADTISRGGDTDTNAAICGALLGAVWGLKSIPDQWQEKVLSCQPKKGNPAIIHPRPEIFWPGEALTLAEKLLNG